MKENRWDSTLPPSPCLEGTFHGRVSPLLWYGKGWKEWGGLRGRIHTPLIMTFSSQSISGKTPPGVHVAAGLSQTLQTWAAERQLIKQLQRVECPVSLDARLPLSSHTHTCTRTTLCRNLWAFLHLSIQSHPCPIQLNKSVIFVMKKHTEKYMYK